jgi:hypothetical protein
MAKQVNLNLTSPLGIVFRKSIPLKSGETILNGQWMELETTGEAKLAGATPGSVRYLAFNDSDRPDVQATLPGGTATSTGGMTAIIGPVEGSVNDEGYNSGSSYNQGDALTVKSGKLDVAGTGDPVFAYVKVAIGADTLLHFVGNSGFAINTGA